MSIEFKPAVRSDGISEKIAYAIIIAHRIWLRDLGESEMTVTSINDGKHMPGSLHYKGDAVDIRAKNLTDDQQKLGLSRLKRVLGLAYDVILHGEGDNIHFHIEYDPK